jgi:hypothetical protein
VNGRSLLFLATLAVTGCIPPMANMQGPEIASRARFTAHYAAIDNPEIGNEDPVDAIGLLLGNPTGDHSEIQVRFDYFRPRNSVDDDDFAFVGIGPKFQAFTRHLALAIPAGIYVGSNGISFETFQIMPGLITGLPLHPRIEPIGAMRVVLPIDSDLERYMIANLGLRLSPISPKWMIIPEMGFAWDLGSDTDTRLESVGIGFAWVPQ